MTDELEVGLHRLWAQDVSHSTGFGMFDHTGDGTYTSWLDYLEDPSPLKAAVDRRRISVRLAESLHSYVLERADDTPGYRSLLHGDFGSDNALTDGCTITGVLDWELAGYGDPLHDIAEILQWEGGEPCMTALARHLRRRLPNDADTRRRLDCYRARICLSELAWGTEATSSWTIDVATAITSGARPLP